MKKFLIIMLVFSNVTCAVNAQTDKRLSLGKVLGFRKKHQNM